MVPVAALAPDLFTLGGMGLLPREFLGLPEAHATPRLALIVLQALWSSSDSACLLLTHHPRLAAEVHAEQ